ncbi:Phenylalanine ammonia-lyase [Vitis vinifera]|uniref:phenylalanine ammonia-lyase n=1 Tax=Vitis vinifera TaxID=29760 RepID=A0A438D3W4_VITVI|nr:Phenylalanine ammonia-lyase [Vitis vinifera]
MSSTYLVALCQAIDLRHLEENLKITVKNTIKPHSQENSNHWSQWRTPPIKILREGLAQSGGQGVYICYIDDPCSETYPLMQKVRQVLVEHALNNGENEKNVSTSIFQKIVAFEEEVEGPFAQRGREQQSRVGEWKPIYSEPNQGLQVIPTVQVRERGAGNRAANSDWNGAPLPIC